MFFFLKKKNYLFGNFSNGRYGRAVEVLVILASLDKEVVLDVGFHLLPRRHKMIIPLVDLVVPFRPGRICQAHSFIPSAIEINDIIKRETLTRDATAKLFGKL